ncbi:MAG: exo-alpha-sialidase [Clostridia bacterium]|nr:exo-alpha-sialidase [Clostridia bacterium]
MYRIINEGDVYVSRDGRCTSGPRTALLADGTLACSFMLNSKSGANDFVPMITYSKDGKKWGKAKEIYPDITGKKSTFISLRNTHDGRLVLGGKQWDIAFPGEAFWSDEAGGMKENRLVYSVSADGKEFPALKHLDPPFYASCENPGGALVDSRGRLTVIYSPYPTTDKKEEVDTCCMVKMTGRIGGAIFNVEKFAVTPEPCLYAESWIEELSDGTLFVSTWQTASADSSQYLYSRDGGRTFEGPFPQPFRGQSTGICAGEDGCVYIAYNQRKEGTVGVWLACERITEDGELEVLANEPVWRAETATRGETSGDFTEWCDFSFGEPHVKLLPDGELLVTLWYEKDGVCGVRYVRLKEDK